MFSQPHVPMDMTSIQHNVAQSIDHYYSQITECITKASRLTLPCRKSGSVYKEYIVPGWNYIAANKHAEAREAYLNWVYAGRVRSGPEFCLMKRTRSQFKLALRYCRQHQETLRADAFAAIKTVIHFGETLRNIIMADATNMQVLLVDVLVRMQLQKCGEIILKNCSILSMLLNQRNRCCLI